MVAHESLGFEGGKNRSVEGVGHGQDVVHVLTCAVAHDDDGPTSPGQEFANLGHDGRRRGDVLVRDPARGPRGRVSGADFTWTSSGMTRWATPLSMTACLRASVVNSAWSESGRTVFE